MTRYLLLFASLFSFFTSGFAQQNISLFGLQHLAEQQSIQPAYISESKFELSLFTLGSNLHSNGPAYADFIGKREANNVLQYPADKLHFDQKNLFRAGSSIETFRFRYNQENWSIGIHHASKAKGIIDYSGALLAVAIQGNAPFIEQNIALDSDFSLFSYEELGLSAAYRLGRFKIGGRIKYLSGHSAAITRRSKVSLLTDEDIYQLYLDMDFDIDVAGQAGNSLSEFNFGPIGLNFTNNDNVIVQSPALLFNLNDDLFNFSGNHGFSIDLGFDWMINEQWNLSFNALDLGKINWKDTPRNYTAKEVFEYDGLSLGQLTFDGTENIAFDSFQDSLDIIDFNRTTNAFSTTLPAQFYLGLNYQLNSQWAFYGTGYYSSFLNNSLYGLSLGGNYQVTEAFNLGLSYNLMNEELFLLGLNASLDVGPIQFFVLTDNLLGAFQLEEVRTVNARIGLTMNFNNNNYNSSLVILK